MTILGIDPGFQYSGFSVLKKDGSRILLVDCGYLKQSSTHSISHRLSVFYDYFEQKIVEKDVSAIALETPFLGKNAQNFLKLGYLHGALYLLSKKYELPVFEYSPRQVKMSLTGFGGASKAQVASVLFRLFPLLKMPLKDDVTDALAIALCGLWAASLKKNQLPQISK